MSRLESVLSRTGTNADLKFKAGSNTDKHTYSFPPKMKLNSHRKALLDYWEFVDLIEYMGGRENFADIHREMAAFWTEPQLVYKAQDDRIIRRMMLVPRGHLKTTLAVAYILWRIYRNPNIRILVTTATKDLAHQIVKLCKQLLESEYLAEKVWNNRPHYEGALIPNMDRGQSYQRRRKQRQDLIEDNVDTEAEDKKIVWRADALQVVRPLMMKEPTLVAASTGTNITGMHFDLIYMDDIINEDTTATADKIQKTFDWAEDLESILDPDRSVDMGEIDGFELREIIGDEKVVTGTRYAKGDYYEYISDNADYLEYKTFIRNIFKNGKNDADGFLWEEKFNPTYVSRLRKRLTTRKFGSQYLNTIITAEEQVLDTDAVIYYHGKDLEIHKNNIRILLADGTATDVRPFIVIDPAISQKKTADNTVIAVGGMNHNRDLFLMDFFCGKVTPSRMIEEMYKLMNKWKLNMVTVEVVAYQQALIHIIKQKFNEYRPITVSEYRPKGEKKARIETNLEPLFSNHKVYMPVWMSTHQELQEEIYYFPAESVHDDILDAASMLVELATPARDTNKSKYRKRVQKVNRKWGGFR
jgi:predicted phage terminase large subunit-like protein